ncbi:MAG TPA: DMT family transporter [Candidatus Baltobacteraceae bacterium]|nr:DMT family transporter [Candidatus Baltobacteraceae bacterium]
MTLVTILLGLAAAAAYGSGDFLGGLATRRAAIFSVVVPVQAVGLAALAVALPFLHGTLSPGAVTYGVLGGITGGAGIALLYRALAVGKMGVVSPITAVLAAALPVVAGTMRGEHLTVLQMAGMATALAAVVLISLTADDDGKIEITTEGVKEAFASGVLLSGFYIFLAFAPKDAGPYPLLFARFASLVLLAGVALIMRQSIVPPRGVRSLTAAGGVLDMGANGLYVAAAQSGFVSIAAVLTSLYPAATVLLAFAFLRERLRLWQNAGLVLALAGVAMISL